MDRLFDNQAFWNQRYETDAEIGSGPGSRGYVISYKRRLVARLLEAHPIRTVLDIGCGDLCFLDHELFASVDYEGIDISEVVIEKNRVSFPALRFAWHDIARGAYPRSVDLVICFDVLIHQIERQAFLSALENTLDCAGRVALISYRTPPGPDGQPPPAAIDPDATPEEKEREAQLQDLIAQRRGAKGRTAFHSPLPVAIAGFGDAFRTEEIGRYRFQTAYLATRKAG